MEIKAEVLAEDVRQDGDKEYVSLTCREIAPKPLLQMFDYSLRQEEKIHKGKLIGKQINIHVQTIRAIFSGRPQMSGIMEIVAAK